MFFKFSIILVILFSVCYTINNSCNYQLYDNDEYSEIKYSRNGKMVLPVNEYDIKAFIKDSSNYKLIHFWGNWCEGQSTGINHIIETANKNRNSLNAFLIATDAIRIQGRANYKLNRKNTAEPWLISIWRDESNY